MARRCSLVRERRERWHGVCVPGLGADILPPAPRQSQCAAGWLEYLNRVPVFGMRFRPPPATITRRRFYGHCAGVCPVAGLLRVGLDPRVTYCAVSHMCVCVRLIRNGQALVENIPRDD